MFKLPYSALLFTGITLLLMSLPKSDNTLDFHFHDTYYIIDTRSTYWFLAAVLIFYWLLYLLTIRLLFSKILTWIHVILTLIFAILLASAPFWLNKPEQSDFDNYIKVAEQVHRNLRITSLSLIILILGQLTFAGNLIAGIIKKMLNSHLRNKINIIK